MEQQTSMELVALPKAELHPSLTEIVIFVDSILTTSTQS